MQSDDELLAAWRAGDRGAGAELFERYFPRLRRFFAAKVDDVEEALQRTFAALQVARERITPTVSFRAYVYAIARHELYADHRRAARAGGVDAFASRPDSRGPSPSEVVVAREEQRLLLRALRSLPIDLQIALELHYWEELGTADLAHSLGVPQGTVKTRLRRARALLKVQMESIAESSELAATTVRDLEHWARSVRPDGQPD
jgi:RNA polymerase sigma-70 factor (ECF subfamily)